MRGWFGLVRRFGGFDFGPVKMKPRHRAEIEIEVLALSCSLFLPLLLLGGECFYVCFFFGALHCLPDCERERLRRLTPSLFLRLREREMRAHTLEALSQSRKYLNKYLNVGVRFHVCTALLVVKLFFRACGGILSAS